MDLSTALAQVNQRREPPFTLAWVTSSTATTVTVVFPDESTLTAPKLRSYDTVTVDDVVLLLRHNGRFYCLGAVNAAPVTPPDHDDSDDEPPAPTTRTRTFRPTSTGTWRISTGWLSTSNLYQGIASPGAHRNIGAAFYGNGPGGLGVPVSAAVSARVRIKRIAGGYKNAQRPTFRLLASNHRENVAPGGYANFLGPAIVPGATQNVPLPIEWAQELIRGRAGGIGIAVPNEGLYPYIGLAGKSTWGPAMELTLTYRTS